MSEALALAGMEFGDDIDDDAPISVLSVSYCDDAFFG